jgi:UDP-N-acetylmuramoyl-L-alanyl-D-glutamate--2,6-diaminopimelate ligase
VRVVAVTGTNGKSSVVSYTRQLLERAGLDAWSLGTFGLQGPGIEPYEPFFVRGHGALRRFLARSLPQGPRVVVVVEAYSVALTAGDWEGLPVDAAAFTSLGRDHLDVHKTEAAYRAAKLRLFDRHLRPGATALVHRSVARTLPGELAALERAEVRLYGHDDPAGFMDDNRACARGLVRALGVDPVGDAETLRPPTGRMEDVRTGRSFRVVVDFAHDPGGLTAALGALRGGMPADSGRLAVVFGCGGDRDRGKRRQMGEVAARLADRVYVTDDHPRREDPAAIRAAIMAGYPAAVEVAGRRAAIERALADARAGDVVLLAGMGHETWGGDGPDADRTDRAVARQILDKGAAETGRADDEDGRDRGLGPLGTGAHSR